jgi:hypothetical protein
MDGVRTFARFAQSDGDITPPVPWPPKRLKTLGTLPPAHALA